MGLLWAESTGYTIGGYSTLDHRLVGGASQLSRVSIVSIVGARTGDMTTIYDNIFDMVAGLTFIGGRYYVERGGRFDTRTPAAT